MTRLNKETRKEIKQYMLDGITSEDKELNTPEEKLKYAMGRFKSEYSHMIERKGQYMAFSEWLQGLALDYDFMNHEILNLAKKWGQDLSTEAKKDKILNDWWPFLTNQFFKLARSYKVVA